MLAKCSWDKEREMKLLLVAMVALVAGSSLSFKLTERQDMTPGQWEDACQVFLELMNKTAEYEHDHEHECEYYDDDDPDHGHDDDDDDDQDEDDHDHDDGDGDHDGDGE